MVPDEDIEKNLKSSRPAFLAFLTFYDKINWQ